MFRLQEGFWDQQFELEAAERAEPRGAAAEEDQRVAGEN